MKKIMSLFLATFLLATCSAEIGSEEWCAELKEKPKGDWTATQAKDFAKHCIFKIKTIYLIHQKNQRSKDENNWPFRWYELGEFSGLLQSH
ncbi:DUF3012 domain-containing protein [Psychromonas sp. KJ10-10]|uniref:DUF3012 domain-containing protein n=1 Tax=Psychromonas sp. KJ10-10 TaxID=3391823 RepID=UPI0039B5695A